MRRRALVAAIVTLAVAAFPALAGAAYTVNVSTDAADTEPLDVVCDSNAAAPGDQCSLRAALEQANASPGGDEVKFSLPAAEKTITVSRPLEITEPATISGCGATNPPEPCVGVRGSSQNFAGIVVRASNVTIRGLAITNFSTGVAYEAGLTTLLFRANWVGTGLGGVDEGNLIGLNLAGNSSIVGGNLANERNVFTNGIVGVRVHGGNGNRISGNYIGAEADGTTLAANTVGVLVAGAPNDPAESNVVGGRVSAAAGATPECDHNCNVIAGSGSGWGVNLNGVAGSETPSVGTNVRANFIGLDATGNVAHPSGTGVEVGSSSGSVGGSSLEEHNHIAATDVGISANSTQAPTIPFINGNLIGLNSAGTTVLSPPSSAGIRIESTSERPIQVFGNRIAMRTGTGIELTGSGGRITGNAIGVGEGGEDFPGGSVGIHLRNAGSANPYRPIFVTGNTVDNAGSVGILLEGSQSVTLTGNDVGVGEGHGNAGPGIKLIGSVGLPAMGNTIGGDPTEANRIENNAGPAILISGNSQDANQILANDGAANAGGFIDLAPPAGPGNDPDTGPNAGIQAPVVLGAGGFAATGTADPGAIVTAYLSASPDGETPAGFGVRLGTATTDGDGKWNLTFEVPVNAGEAITAVQADAAGNTSEPATAFEVDLIPPDPPQILSAPGDATNQQSPTFSFAGEQGATFVCAIDVELPVPCDGGSFTPAAPLAPGYHVFLVAQTDVAGNPGAQAFVEFIVDVEAPGEPQIDSGPDPLSRDPSPTFAFSGEVGARFRCALDGAAPAPCDSGRFAPVAPLADGPHSFQVSQVDPAGNEGPAATRDFSLDTAAPAAPEITDGPEGATGELVPTFSFSGEAGARFRCVLDGAAPVACNGRTFTPPGLLSEGPHSFQVSQTDAAGNPGPAASRDFVVDVTAPAEPQITGGPEGPVGNAAPTFSFNGEAGAGFRCAIDGDVPVACDGGSFAPGTSLAPGPHRFRVSQVDAAGNEGPEAQRDFSVDLTPPAEPRITAGPSGPIRQATPSFAFSGEAGAGFSCAFDGDGPVACDGGTFSPAAPLGDGSHVFRVFQTDLAGNVGPEATRSFAVDTTAPAPPQITAGPTGLTNQARPTFAFATEAGASLRCRFDSDQEIACGGGAFTPAVALGDGTHAFRVAAVDAAGNRGPDASAVFTVDATAPAAPEITAGPSGSTAETKPSFAFRGEPGAHFACSLDAATPAPCDSGSFAPASALAEGPHAFRVRQTDAAGNFGPAAGRDFVVTSSSGGGGEGPGEGGGQAKPDPKRDTSPPDTAVKGPRTLRKATDAFVLSSSEPRSSFQCKLGRRPWKPCRSRFQPKRILPGKHVLVVRAVDTAGNVDPTPAKRAFWRAY